MIKVKGSRTADGVVAEFRYETNSHEAGSLLLGLYDEGGKLDHVGFTSTIVDVERASLTRKLEGLRRPRGFTGKAPAGPSRWGTDRSGEWEPLRPELVVEVLVEVRFDHVSGHRQAQLKARKNRLTPWPRGRDKLGPRELRGGSRSLQDGHNLLKHIARFLPQFAK
jgi:ATP-dependent DNA ligase